MAVQDGEGALHYAALKGQPEKGMHEEVSEVGDRIPNFIFIRKETQRNHVTPKFRVSKTLGFSLIIAITIT